MTEVLISVWLVLLSIAVIGIFCILALLIWFIFINGGDQ